MLEKQNRKNDAKIINCKNLLWKSFLKHKKKNTKECHSI